MKNLKIIIISFLLLCTKESQAQLLTRSAAKIINVSKHNFKSSRFGPQDAFEYNGKSYIITSGIKVNMKLSTGVYGEIAKGIGGALVNIPGKELGKLGYYNLNSFLIELDPTEAGLKGAQVKKIDIPASLENSKYIYLGFLQKEEKVNLYMGTVNSKQGKSYVFCVTYNLKSEEVVVNKVFETIKKNDPVAFFKSEKYGLAGLASAYGQGRNPIVNYTIMDENNVVKSRAEELEMPGLNKTSISDFLIGSNGELVFGAYHKKGKDYINDVYVLKGDNNFKSIKIPSKEYHSKRKLYLGANDIIKTVFLAGADKKYYTELVIADLDLANGRAINQEVKSFESLKLDESDKEYKTEKKKEKNAQNDYWLNTIKTASDGSTMLLMEHELHYSSTSTNSAGGTRTRETHRYGPGKLILLDKDNNFNKTTKLTYLIQYSYNRGHGLDFLPLDNNNIIIQNGNNFKKYNLNSNDIDLGDVKKQFSGMSGLVKGIQGNSEYFIQSDSKVYLVKITDKTKFRIQFIEVI